MPTKKTKSTSAEFLTKSYFESYMSGYRTETDKRFQEQDAKIASFREEVNKRFRIFETYMAEFRTETKEHFNRITNTLDHVMKMFEDWRTENTMGAAQSRRHDDRLEEHERRIAVLEEKVAA